MQNFGVWRPENARNLIVFWRDLIACGSMLEKWLVRPGNLLFGGSRDMENSYRPERVDFTQDFDGLWYDFGSGAEIILHRPVHKKRGKYASPKYKNMSLILCEKEIDKKITKFTKNSWNLPQSLV
ncbi:MAG: hypothetical protein E7292_03985 [Lachnospiraceae bacterium]|nr:hypothetical protein [Lachnospiraceae bacterium]